MDDIAGKLLSEFQDKQFEIGGTQFTAEKLLPMEGFAVLEEIRESVGNKFNSLESSTIDVSMFVSVILAIPSSAVMSVSDKLFRHVSFTNSNYQSPAILRGNVDGALEGQDSIVVYEIFIRCLAINFFSSFQGLLSRILAKPAE